MDDYKLIPLSGKYGKGKFAKVSHEDYERLSQYNWYVTQGYVETSAYPKHYRMHRMVLNAEYESAHIDHINRDKLDNRRSNLRLCSQAENNRNVHQKGRGANTYQGVRFDKKLGKWTANFHFEGKNYYLGAYDSEIDAAKVRDGIAKFLDPNFSFLNFPDVKPINPDTFILPYMRGDKTSSIYQGVSWSSQKQKWHAIAKIKGRSKHIGFFDDEVEAAKARDSVVLYYGATHAKHISFRSVEPKHESYFRQKR